MSDKDLPAFPCEWDYIGSNRAAANGMTLRDYFAAKAMAALLTSQYPYTADESASKEMESWPEFAQGAYQMADAMLKARSE